MNYTPTLRPKKPIPEEKYCPGCDQTLPVSEFYVYEYVSERCKACKREQYRLHYHEKKVKDASYQLGLIRKKAKAQRFTAALALYEAGTITQGEFRTILQKVEF